MPVYEYEANEWACAICDGRFEALQSIDEQPLKHCPTCGQEVVKVISKATIKISKFHGHDHAGKKGFTTYKRSEVGVWEKVAGDGVDVILGSEEDKQIVSDEQSTTTFKAQSKIINLDE